MNKLVVLGVILVITLGTTIVSIPELTPLAVGIGQEADGALLEGGFDIMKKASRAPIATSGDNMYVTWWTNDTGNDEIMFRASADGGATFVDKINLSNTTGADSQDVEIAALGDTVTVTWWERNATSNEPVVRISSDNGATFGPLLKLAANGTIGE